MRKVNYIQLCDFPKDEPLQKELDIFVENHPHNSGMAWEYMIELEDAAYPLITEYLLKNGGVENEIVILHSIW